jgi:hypothetical protein
MSRPGNNHEPFFIAEPLERQPVQLYDLKVIPADDEQRRRLNAYQSRPGQIRAPAPRDDCTYHIRALGCRH